MRVDRVHVAGCDAGVLDRLGHAAPDRLRLGHEVVGVGGHPPAGHLNPPGNSVSPGEGLRGQDEAPGTLGDDKSPPVPGKGAAHGTRGSSSGRPSLGR